MSRFGRSRSVAIRRVISCRDVEVVGAIEDELFADCVGVSSENTSG